jgi:hypothetical protein
MTKINNRQIEQSTKFIIITILKLLGCEIPMNSISEFDDVIWEMNMPAILTIKENIESFIDGGEIKIKTKS